MIGLVGQPVLLRNASCPGPYGTSVGDLPWDSVAYLSSSRVVFSSFSSASGAVLTSFDAAGALAEFHSFEPGRPQVVSMEIAGVFPGSNNILIAATDTKNGKEPYVFNPTSGTMALIADLSPGCPGSLGDLFTLQSMASSRLLFPASTPSSGTEMFTSDGTTATLLAELGT